MAHFKLIPVNSALDCIEFDAVSAASVLDIALHSALGETDVYCDGPYQCTVVHGGSGVWTITQRKMALRYGGKPASPAGETTRIDLQAPFSRELEMA